MHPLKARQLLLDMYSSAVAAVSAEKCLPAFLPKPPPNGRTMVIGAGKGAAAMAKTVEEYWQGDIGGLVATRYGHGTDCKRIEVVEAAHPIPDEAGRNAAIRMMNVVRGLTENDLVLCLIILSDRMEGEARDVGMTHAALVRQIALRNQPFHKPCVLISGGETMVTVRGSGRGGRNAEFLLSLAATLNGLSGIHAIACDTDGIDGSEDNSGAIYQEDSMARAETLGLCARTLLDSNDGYGFFSALGDLVVTGPTRTNVNDFRAILIL